MVSVLLEPSAPPQVPDMSPFFLKPYSVSQTKDIFYNYPIILTEMLLRLPYQIQKSWPQLYFEPVCFIYIVQFNIFRIKLNLYGFILLGMVDCIM